MVEIAEAIINILTILAIISSLLIVFTSLIVESKLSYDKARKKLYGFRKYFSRRHKIW